MNHLSRFFCGGLLLLAAAAQATTVSIGNSLLGCTVPDKVAISPTGVVWTPCNGVITALYYYPGDYGAALPPAIAVDKIDLPTFTAATALAFDNNDNIWFTDYFGDRIGRANTKTKSVSTFSVPTGTRPDGIAFGDDGNMYVAGYGSGTVMKVTPAGVITSVAGVGAGHHVRGILTSGISIAFGDYDACRILEYSTLFQITTSTLVPCDKLYDLIKGPDGLAWYAGGSKIGKLTVNGVVSYTPPAGTHAVAIAAAPDGTLWYAGDNGAASPQARMGQMTTSGVATELTLPAQAGTIGYVAVRPVDGTVFFTLPTANKQGYVWPAASTAPDAVVTEFHNSLLDHYFITASAAEATAIDNGSAGPGWSRTGQTFKAWTNGPLPNASPVCRFYGNQAAGGPNSHFFTVVAAECATVQTDPGWTLETTTAYWIVQPTPQCPAFTLPVYRDYNNRFAQHDSNHRFTTDLATFNAMGAQGWTKEGVVMCAPH